MSLNQWQVRISEAIEACDGQLDSTLTSQLSIPGLLRLLWVLTRQPPTVSIPSLRVEFYSQLNTKLRLRHEVLLKQTGAAGGDSSVGASLQEIKNSLDVTDEFLQSMADPLGFKAEWMMVKLGKTAARARQVAAAKNQASIAPLLQQSTGIAVDLDSPPHPPSRPQVAPLLPPPPTPSRPVTGAVAAAASSQAPLSLVVAWQIDTVIVIIIRYIILCEVKAPSPVVGGAPGTPLAALQPAAVPIPVPGLPCSIRQAFQSQLWSRRLPFEQRRELLALEEVCRGLLALEDV